MQDANELHVIWGASPVYSFSFHYTYLLLVYHNKVTVNEMPLCLILCTFFKLGRKFKWDHPLCLHYSFKLCFINENLNTRLLWWDFLLTWGVTWLPILSVFIRPEHLITVWYSQNNKTTCQWCVLSQSSRSLARHTHQWDRMLSQHESVYL